VSDRTETLGKITEEESKQKRDRASFKMIEQYREGEIAYDDG
jgi:hypothetical protein